MGVYAAFADLLSYPSSDLLAVVDRCVTEVRPGEPDDAAATGVGHGSAAALSAGVGQGSALARDLLAFRTNAERLGPAGVEEAYTRAFDLEPASCLYVGHHLFGETTRRSLFMARLSAMYRGAGGPATTDELPDDLPRVLRYVDANLESTASRELLSDAVVPALRQVLAALDRTGHPYAPVLRALLAHARTDASTSTAVGTAV